MPDGDKRQVVVDGIGILIELQGIHTQTVDVGREIGAEDGQRLWADLLVVL